jgi:co-chaperonin GroES (HSP10)
MQPIKNKVLIEVIEPKETTESGIFIPLNNRIDNEGIVSAVGPKVTCVAPGDKIRYYKGFGIPMEVHGKKCLFLTDEQIELIL